jgi:hypothetical protein
VRLICVKEQSRLTKATLNEEPGAGDVETMKSRGQLEAEVSAAIISFMLKIRPCAKGKARYS